MKVFTDTLPFAYENPIISSIFDHASLFYDIETTGFTAKNSKIYFIGCAYREENHLVVVQYFSENNQDEKEVLEAFHKLCENFTSTITFNGFMFDMPFILERSKMLHISNQMESMKHLDIYKEIKPYKTLLGLSDLKQKSIEQFLGIHREDKYNGGQLIQVYKDYLISQDPQLLEQLWLHNKEDVVGMIDILPILSYPSFMKENWSFDHLENQSYTDYVGTCKKELLFYLTPKYPFPVPFSFSKDDIYISASSNRVCVRVLIYHGECKYFYENYKDYYYLPMEDVAIHKSVAEFVEKEFRQKAKPCNCYTKKSGAFLPQYEKLFAPAFLLNYKDKISYFELSDSFNENQLQQELYIKHILYNL